MRSTFIIVLLSCAVSSVEASDSQFSSWIPKLKLKRDQQVDLGLAVAFLQHTFLVYLQSKSSPKSVKDMLKAHTALWVCRQCVGMLGTLSHEFGHALTHSLLGGKIGEVHVYWKYRNLIDGLYSGRTILADSAPCLDQRGERSAHILQTNKVKVLQYCAEAKEYRLKMIPMLLAGPIVGCASIYVLSKMLKKLPYSELCNPNLMILFNVCMMAQDIMSLNPLDKRYDTGKAVSAWYSLKGLEALKESIKHLRDDQSLVIDFTKEIGSSG